MPDAASLARYRAAAAAAKSGTQLAGIVDELKRGGYQIMSHEVLKTAPRGFPADHPRIELLRHKGIATMKTWPVAAWLGTAKAKERVVTALRAADPLDAWLTRYVD